MRHRHPLPFGAELVGGGTRFRLWAPDARRVDLAIEGGAALPMAAEPGGWFALTTAAIAVGGRYRYRIDDGICVPDPASRFQPQDAHGPSEIVDPAAYDWRETGWQGRPWEETVVYELHTGTFSETGDFDGIRRHLDHLAGLGVTAVELMPVGDFPGARNWGYDGVLLFAPDARYGRPDDLKRLVEACHERRLGIFLDVVYNHFGPDGNYLHLYAPQFFTQRRQTPWGAAIDFDGPLSHTVRDFYIHNALYWLEEYRFDGLRFDAVHAIHDDSNPDIVTEIAETIRHRITDRPVHLILENDVNQAQYLRRGTDGRPILHTAQWNDDLHHTLRVVTAGQEGGYYADYADRPAGRLGRALAEGFAYQGEASAYRGGEARGSPCGHLPPTAFVSFIENHDQVGNDAFGRRLLSLASPEAVRAAAATYLLAPEIPMLFQGQEWGATQPFLFFCDFADAELAAAVRRGRREEFARFPEFSDPAARERIPDPGAEATWRASVLDWNTAAREPHRQWLAFYRTLLELRAREIVPRLHGITGHAGSWQAFGERGLRVDWRLGDGARLTLIGNYGDAPVPRPHPIPEGRLLYATPDGASGPVLARHAVAFWLQAAHG
jgi:maltooligosyltrehalose trehalohydrolase